MSVAKAAERFDLVRLMDDEGASLPPAKEPCKYGGWAAMVHDEIIGEWSMPTPQEAEILRQYAVYSHALDRQVMQAPLDPASSPPTVRFVGTAGNHDESPHYNLARVARQQARPWLEARRAWGQLVGRVRRG